MIGVVSRTLALAGVLWLAVSTSSAQAQSEYPPGPGKGRVVIVISGHLGAHSYEGAAREVARMGYDAVLLDANELSGSHGERLKAAIEQAQQSPHAIAGKVGVVGFSQGGGQALAYAAQWPDLVAAVIGWYPVTSFVHDPDGFVMRLKVPVLILAAENDVYHNCCMIATARAIAAAGAAKGLPVALVSYPGADHDFLLPGRHYDGHAISDGWQRTAAALKAHLGP
jgi:dienelactone hydrolase